MADQVTVYLHLTAVLLFWVIRCQKVGTYLSSKGFTCHLTLFKAKTLISVPTKSSVLSWPLCKCIDDACCLKQSVDVDKAQIFSGVKTTFHCRIVIKRFTFRGLSRKPTTKQNRQNDASMTLHFSVFFIVVVHIAPTASRRNVSGHFFPNCLLHYRNKVRETYFLFHHGS